MWPEFARPIAGEERAAESEPWRFAEGLAVVRSVSAGEKDTWGQPSKEHPRGLKEMILGTHKEPEILLVSISQSGKVQNSQSIG